MRLAEAVFSGRKALLLPIDGPEIGEHGLSVSEYGIPSVSHPPRSMVTGDVCPRAPSGPLVPLASWAPGVPTPGSDMSWRNGPPTVPPKEPPSCLAWDSVSCRRFAHLKIWVCWMLPSSFDPTTMPSPVLVSIPIDLGPGCFSHLAALARRPPPPPSTCCALDSLVAKWLFLVMHMAHEIIVVIHLYKSSGGAPSPGFPRDIVTHDQYSPRHPPQKFIVPPIPTPSRLD
ncbi:hypothetical protein B0T25DRAFT_124896 [Lasiosphaeria hispida]|uniref:Uncharacterized protein n=1 Tax=Lasiosphaeria hispida TaxID=260671 RepID=A0AAJ0HRS7_9PEZI|nr:hypothetical protein B0T25DRAFT_124896 [Lasiosphaeria hispida]